MITKEMQIVINSLLRLNSLRIKRKLNRKTWQEFFLYKNIIKNNVDINELDDKVKKIDEDLLREQNNFLASHGYRVIALASSEIKNCFHSAGRKTGQVMKMSLSPRPLIFTMIALSFGSVGASLIAWAPACALSIAKRTPSFLAKNFTAFNAS